MKRKLVLTIKGPMSPVVSRLPDNMISYIDRDADQQLRTRSDIVRSWLVEYCRLKGIAVEAGAEDAEVVA